MKSDEPPDSTLTAPSEAGLVRATARSAQHRPLPTVETENYQTLGEQGRGGIGVVHRVRDLRLDRVVAIKELQQPSGAAQARFEREMRITARLQHPGIVPIHECGRWPDGSLFYAMKLVEGRSLRELIAEKRSLRDRLTLLPHVLAVADTVAYAHRAGVIHRDLKPSNVIVGEFGETVVIDWGLAKDTLGPDDSPEAGPFRQVVGDGVTVVGQVLGTPAYMAPEQARGEAVDARADVYSMGALLFHLLAGRPPQAGSSEEAVKRAARGLREAAPVDAPRDLVAIVDKAMSARREDRYADGAEMANELRRYSTGQLVEAHAYSSLELVSRWMRANRSLVLLGSAALLLVAVVAVLGIRGVLTEQDNVRHERDAAEAGRREAQAQTNELLLAQAIALIEADPTEASRRLAAHVPENEDRDLLTWLRLEAQTRGIADRHDFRTPAAARAVEILAGNQFAFVFEQGVRGGGQILDLQTGRVGAQPRGLSFVSGTRRRVVWLEQSLDRATDRDVLELWVADAPEFQPTSMGRMIPPPDAQFLGAGLSRSGRWLAMAAGYPHPTQLWYDFETRGWSETHTPVESIIHAVADDRGPSIWHGGGNRITFQGDTANHCPAWNHLLEVQSDSERRWFLNTSKEGSVEVCDAWSGKIFSLKQASVVERTYASFDDFEPFVLVRRRNVVELNDLVHSTTQRMELDPGTRATAGASRGANLVAIGTNEGKVIIWRPQTGHQQVLTAHTAEVISVDLSEDGRRLATLSIDGHVRTWNVQSEPGRLLARTGAPVVHISVGAGGLRLVTSDGLVQRRSRQGTMLSSTRVNASVHAAVEGDHGHRIYLLDEAGVLSAVDPTASPSARVLATDVASLVGSEDGNAVGFRRGGDIRIIGPGDRDWTYSSHDEILGLSRGGERALVLDQGDVAAWKLTAPEANEGWFHITSGTVLMKAGLEGPITLAALAPDDRYVAMADVNGNTRVSPARLPWYGHQGPGLSIGTHAGGATGIAFDTTAEWAASVGNDGFIWIRHEQRGRLGSHICRGAVTTLAAFPGMVGTFAVGCRDGTVRVLDAQRRRRALLLGHRMGPTLIRFSPDQASMLTSGPDGDVWEWNQASIPWRTDDALFSFTDASPWPSTELLGLRDGLSGANAMAQAGAVLPELLQAARSRAQGDPRGVELALPPRPFGCPRGFVEFREEDLPRAASLWDHEDVDAGPGEFPASAQPTTYHHRYAVRLEGPTLVATAYGDLDCDGIFSVVEARQPLADPSAPIDWRFERTGE